jgi:hypothetical protein
MHYWTDPGLQQTAGTIWFTTWQNADTPAIWNTKRTTHVDSHLLNIESIVVSSDTLVTIDQDTIPQPRPPQSKSSPQITRQYLFTYAWFISPAISSSGYTVSKEYLIGEEVEGRGCCLIWGRPTTSPFSWPTFRNHEKPQRGQSVPRARSKLDTSRKK